MTGIETYATRLNHKIENLLFGNMDIKYLSDFANYLSSGRSDNTVYQYLKTVVAFIRWTGKSPEDIRLLDYLGYMRTVKRFTPSYQILIYSSLKVYAEFLTVYEPEGATGPVVDKDYMEVVKRPKFFESVTTVEKRDRNYLRTAEIVEYLDSIKNYDVTAMLKAGIPDWRKRDLLIAMILLSTGMRCAALYKLDVDSIDIEEGVLITIDKGSKTKIYELSQSVLDAACEWLEFRESFLQRKGKTEESALFVNQYGDRLAPGGISEVTRKYGRIVTGRDDITPHKLRSTFGTELYRQTHDVFFVQKAMEHSSSKVTERYIRGQGVEFRKRTSDLMSSVVY